MKLRRIENGFEVVQDGAVYGQIDVVDGVPLYTSEGGIAAWSSDALIDLLRLLLLIENDDIADVME